MYNLSTKAVYGIADGTQRTDSCNEAAAVARSNQIRSDLIGGPVCRPVCIVVRMHFKYICTCIMPKPEAQLSGPRVWASVACTAHDLNGIFGTFQQTCPVVSKLQIFLHQAITITSDRWRWLIIHFGYCWRREAFSKFVLEVPRLAFMGPVIRETPMSVHFTHFETN